jgi:hypothetical protein
MPAPYLCPVRTGRWILLDGGLPPVVGLLIMHSIALDVLRDFLFCFGGFEMRGSSPSSSSSSSGGEMAPGRPGR